MQKSANFTAHIHWTAHDKDSQRFGGVALLFETTVANCFIGVCGNIVAAKWTYFYHGYQAPMKLTAAVSAVSASRIRSFAPRNSFSVEWHRTNLMSKLGVHNVADLVRYALQQGLVEENE
jgi:hypothetical protein